MPNLGAGPNGYLVESRCPIWTQCPGCCINGSFKGASRGASRRLENGFKGACRGLEGEGLEGALKEGLEKVLKGASR